MKNKLILSILILSFNCIQASGYDQDNEVDGEMLFGTDDINTPDPLAYGNLFSSVSQTATSPLTASPTTPKTPTAAFLLKPGAEVISSPSPKLDKKRKQDPSSLSAEAVIAIEKLISNHKK
jgi:hypothetical protein